MPKNLKLYVILTYLLIPISLLFALLDVALLLSALTNPGALIMVFIIACLVIYTYVSFKFFSVGIQREQPLENKLKDWIKVNAYVSFLLCALFFINSISILISNDVTLLGFIDEFLQQQPGLPAEMTSQLVLSIMKSLAIFLFIVSCIGLLHIRMTLSLIKQYDYLFE